MGRVLIVEDDAEAAQHFADWLRREGYDVETAPDGETGLALASSGGFDAIVLDLLLPGISGLDVVRRLRAIPSCAATPVGVITGHYLVEDSTVAELHDAGVHVRYKPLWLEDLADLARTLVTRP